MKFKSLIFFLAVSMFSITASALDRRVVEVSTDEGYATAYCPSGYLVESCHVDRNDCDNISETRTSCTADSRNHRLCLIRANCIRPEIEARRVVVNASTNGRYKEVACPEGYRLRKCKFEIFNCSNTHEGRRTCGAEARWDNRRCDFSAVCVDRYSLDEFGISDFE